MSGKTKAPIGDLSSYQLESFSYRGMTHPIYRKGNGPAVIIISEMPGITPQQLGFADRIAAMGCTAVLPHLFGEAGRSATERSGKLDVVYTLRSLAKVCISREFTLLAAGVSAPIIDWLRGLAGAEHARCKGPGVGAIGMCFSGGFALAMAVHPSVVAPVLSQPSLPGRIGKHTAAAIDCSDADLAKVAGRCANERLKVLGLRFHGDPYVPKERFEFLRQKLGDGFVAVELPQSAGHPENFLPAQHSVLTHSLVDEPGELTRAALDQVLHLFRTKLLS